VKCLDFQLFMFLSNLLSDWLIGLLTLELSLFFINFETLFLWWGITQLCVIDSYCFILFRGLFRTVYRYVCVFIFQDSFVNVSFWTVHFYPVLTVRKIAIWMSKNGQNLTIGNFVEKNDNFCQFFWKKCQVLGNVLTVKWQFSGGTGVYTAQWVIWCVLKWRCINEDYKQQVRQIFI